MPSTLTQGGGGGGWAPATGAMAIAETAAAPANNMGIIFDSLAFIAVGYHERRTAKPKERRPCAAVVRLHPRHVVEFLQHYVV